MIETSRRTLITGLVSFVAAPAIVRASSLMPVKKIETTPKFGQPLILFPKETVYHSAGEYLDRWAYFFRLVRKSGQTDISLRQDIYSLVEESVQHGPRYLGFDR